MVEPTPTPPTWRERLELIVGPSRPPPSQVAGAAVAVVALLVGAWFVLRQPPGPPAEASMSMAEGVAMATTSTTAASTVVVHAAGAVRVPGVYTLTAGARVTDLLDAAGGPAPDADLDRLNLAAPVADGSRVYVPRVGEPVPDVSGGGGATAGSAPSGPLDLNTATLEQLDALPGIGPATAKAILDERAKRGRFRSVDDLLDVRGIGPAKFDQLRDLVTV